MRYMQLVAKPKYFEIPPVYIMKNETCSVSLFKLNPSFMDEITK